MSRSFLSVMIRTSTVLLLLSIVVLPLQAQSVQSNRPYGGELGRSVSTASYPGSSPENVTKQVKATVVQEPIFVASRRVVAFDDVPVPTSKNEVVTIMNTGAAPLTITNVMSSHIDFSVLPNAGTIAPGDSQQFQITFFPTTVGVKDGAIFFDHNATPAHDTIFVSGRGVGAEFSVSSMLINLVRNFVGTTMLQYRIANTGRIRYTFSVIQPKILIRITPMNLTLPRDNEQVYYSLPLPS